MPTALDVIILVTFRGPFEDFFKLEFNLELELGKIRKFDLKETISRLWDYNYNISKYVTEATTVSKAC